MKIKTIIIAKLIRVFLFSALIFFASSCTIKVLIDDAEDISFGEIVKSILPEDIVNIENLPPLGKWMYTSECKYADWLGTKSSGKVFREPINIIIVDSVSASVEEAKDNLIKNFDEAGFEIRPGHSAGYLGYIENKFYSQLPGQSSYAFSDAPFIVNNCHGRIFGPCVINGVYYFSGSLSKEKIAFDVQFHHFDSFNVARNKLAENLNSKTKYKILSYVDMHNTIETDSLSTGDHDSKGILISVNK